MDKLKNWKIGFVHSEHIKNFRPDLFTWEVKLTGKSLQVYLANYLLEVTSKKNIPRPAKKNPKPGWRGSICGIAFSRDFLESCSPAELSTGAKVEKISLPANIFQIFFDLANENRSNIDHGL